MSKKNRKFMAISEIPYYSIEWDYIFAFNTFLDEFYKCDDIEKEKLLLEEPKKGILDKVQYSKLAAAAHKLANDYNLSIPSWVMKDEYIMPYPVYSFDTKDTEHMELLREITPDEYKVKNLFLGPKVLSRA